MDAEIIDSLVVDWRESKRGPALVTPSTHPNIMGIFTDPDIADHIKVALAVNFTEEEIKALYYAVSEERDAWGRRYFLGVGFTGPGGKFTKHAAPHKAEAVRVLEEALVRELEEMGQVSLDYWREGRF